MTTLARPPFPEVIDNSQRSTFRQCPRKWELMYLNHWKPRIPSIHLHAGAAFAKGVETVRRSFYVEGKGPDESIVDGWRVLVEAFGDYVTEPHETKTVDRMCSALVYYFDVFKLESDFVVPYTLENGERVFEFSFALPVDVEHPETGQPLLYYGRFDMVGQHDNGGLYIVDEKTAKQLGQSWVEGWSLDSQFTGYCWGARKYSMPVIGAIIRGISILKNGHGHAQSIQTRSQWEIDRWYRQLCADLTSMIRMWKAGYFDYDLGGGCKAYGGCDFRTVCKSPNPERWLDGEFEQREYRPYEGKF